MPVAELETTVVLGPRSLSLTVHLAGGVTLFAEMPRPADAATKTEGDLERLAKAQAGRLFRAAAEDLA